MKAGDYMGAYFNPSNEKFREALNSAIYVDKTELIHYTNSVLHTSQKCICVSRPRRFGKSMAANMLSAYYSRGCDSSDLFSKYKIAEYEDFPKHLNRYDVIALNMQEFLSRTHNITDMLCRLQQLVMRDLKRHYPDTDYFDEEDLIQSMQDIYEETHHPFILIIDEWDCVFREFKHDFHSQKLYLNFLRDFLKDRGYIHLVYMTGILPVKKYGTHSALNMFDEFSMLYAGPLAGFFGFTEAEVKALCLRYQMDFDEEKSWYDGYYLKGIGSVYNPRSVVSSMHFHEYGNFWNQTETFEALKLYIDMNLAGLKDRILSMMSGQRIYINTGSFSNDMTSMSCADDVLTLLVHLGYLGYDSDTGQAFIPNQEIMNEYVNAIVVSDWGKVSHALSLSAQALETIWNHDADMFASVIQEAHFETSILQYNDENALSYTISLALYAARNYYTIHREMAGGKGYADVVFLPRRKFPDKPALLIELKWNRPVQSAIDQIREKGYYAALSEYMDNLLLIEVTYDTKTKQHTCIIEKYQP